MNDKIADMKQQRPLETAQEILSKLDEHSDELRRLGVRRIGLFGSYRLGRARPGSDLDFLVTLERNSFDGYMNVRLFLEDLFGREVDLLPEGSIKPRSREQILRDVMYAQGL